MSNNSGNGISTNYLPITDNASAWIYLTSGQATLFDYQDSGIGGYATDTTIGKWVQLNPTITPGTTSNYIAIEAGNWNGNGGAANFYVGLVQANGAVPESSTITILLLGGAFGALCLRSLRYYQAVGVGKSKRATES